MAGEHTNKRPSKLTLSGHLDIDGSGKLHRRLMSCAAKGLDVHINAAKVESANTSSLQLLLAFVIRIHENGNTVKWKTPSDALIRSAALAGLESYLCLGPGPSK